VARLLLTGRRGSKTTGNLDAGRYGASTSRGGICFALFTSRFGAKRAGLLVPGYMLYPDTPGAAGPLTGPSKQRLVHVCVNGSARALGKFGRPGGTFQRPDATDAGGGSATFDSSSRGTGDEHLSVSFGARSGSFVVWARVLHI
jgi:hypothetical protein